MDRSGRDDAPAEPPDSTDLLGRMTAAFFAVDGEWRFTYLNSRGREVVREATEQDLPEELVGEELWESVPEAVDTVFYEQYRQAMETGEAVTFEAFYDPLDTWFEVRAYPDDDGLSVFFQDVSDRVEQKRRLQQQNERLEEFASVVSHDLRNPLNIAEGNLTLAREECEAEALDAVDDALDRMDAIIDDVLTLAREGEAVTALDEVELEAAAREAWETVGTGGATLGVETDATVSADADRLQRLLENLFRNAIEHGGEEVSVRVGERSGGPGFYVADDGPGIPTDEREQVFESGYSTDEEGTGFGLAIVREIAAAHGWEVAATESPRGGARFEVRT